MSTLQLLFSCTLGKIILKLTDSLSKTLQNPSISAAPGQEKAHLVIETLWNDRCDKNLNHFGPI